MNLTHHVKSTRSFILLTIIVLLTVYTAVVLSGIQSRNVISDVNSTNPINKSAQFDTTNWQQYQDTAYPLLIKFPETWTYSADITSLAGFYTVNLLPPKSKNPIRIYISDKDFVAVDNLKGNQQTIAKNLTVTNYDDLIYTIKVGDYYYTFDGTMNESIKSELSEIVRLARFE